MTGKVRITDHGYGDREVKVFDTEHPDQTASLAMNFVERWGMVCGEVDGEDSAGRQKLRLSTPDELVTRAFVIAEKLMAAARERGHMITLPDLNEINKEVDEKNAAKRLSAQS